MAMSRFQVNWNAWLVWSTMNFGGVAKPSRDVIYCTHLFLREENSLKRLAVEQSWLSIVMHLLKS